MSLLQLVLLAGTASALKYPYFSERSFNASDFSSMSKRDDPNDNPGFWSVSYHDGGCGGPANYGAYDNKPYQCFNLVHDKPWNSLVIGTNGGTDLMFFEELDCCTSSSNNPCSIFTGYQRDTCVTSIGSGEAGSVVAKSFAVVNHAFNGASGPADAGACGAAGGTTCGPPDKGGSCPHKRSTDEYSTSLETCERALNCETWVNPKTNRRQIRFKEGMGPGSDWYHHNVTLKDPWSSINKNRFTKRAPCPGDTYYYADRETDVVQYGFDNSDPPASAREHCLSNNCKQTWRTSETGTKDGFVEYFTLEYEGDGQYSPEQRDYFIDALRFNGKPSHDGDEEYAIVDAPSETGHNYYGTTFTDVNRFIRDERNNEVLGGHISLRLTADPDAADTCDFAKDILSGAAGAVSGIGGGFFGALFGVTCHAVSGN